MCRSRLLAGLPHIVEGASECVRVCEEVTSHVPVPALTGPDASSVNSNDIQAVVRLVGYGLNPFADAQQDTLQYTLFLLLQISSQVSLRPPVSNEPAVTSLCASRMLLELHLAQDSVTHSLHPMHARTPVAAKSTSTLVMQAMYSAVSMFMLR